MLIPLMACLTLLTPALAHLPANRPELSLPLADRKLVIAHYMTGMLPTPGAETGAWMDPAKYDPQGPTAIIGGQYQTLPVTMLLHPQLLPPRDAALLEMQAAKAIGIDGFNFYYPFGPDDAFRDRYDGFILAFFDAAEEHRLDFKLTLCFAPYANNPRTTQEKIEILGRHLRKLVEATADSDHWLKTPDGRHLFYTWIADGMANEPLSGKHWLIRERPELLADVAASLDRIATSAGVRGAFLYHLDLFQDEAVLQQALDYFPGVTGWVNVGDDLPRWRDIAAKCKARGRTYVQEVHPDYYTSKLHPVGGYDLITDVQRINELGLAGIERHDQILGLTQTFRDKLQMAIDLDSPLINLTTWNDFPEGHHLAPEINHNFGFSMLLRHYTARWRGRPEDGPTDVAAVFFKKYPAAITPEPFNIAVKHKRQIGPPSADDGVEVVTILKEPGELHINSGDPVAVPAGLAVTRVAPLPEPGAGPLRVEVTRNGRTVVAFTTSEWTTNKPYRTDRLTYTYSSDHAQMYRAIYGDDAPIHTSMEYTQDAAGVPQWRRGVRTLLDASAGEITGR